MSRNGSRRVVFSPDIREHPAALLRSGTIDRSAGVHARRVPRSSAYRVCRKVVYLPVRLFRCVGANVAQALCSISCNRSSSAKVSPKAFSWRFAPPQESHHAEAIEDCIKFINSSSTKSR